MNNKAYNPFENLIENFNSDKCFLSGEEANGLEINVFPEWILSQYNLNLNDFKFLDESIIKYDDIKVPVSIKTKEKLNLIESKVKKAINSNFSEIRNIDSILLFQWMGKIVYGIIYNEIKLLLKSSHQLSINISQSLLHKFSNLQLMLQSMVFPVQFEGFKPYSIYLFELEDFDTPFVFRDDIHTLTASIKMKNLGIIINLQDNGMNKIYHKDLLEKLNSKCLSQKQFDEVCAKVYYSAYLFNRLPEYHTYIINDEILIEPVSFYGFNNKPLFDDWNNKVYAQVLESFWSKYNITINEILSNPENPVSSI